MDKKKVIGTVIGVIAFIALLAGATYAWLTNTLGVTNGVYNTKTMNFLVNYTKGTDVTSLPILGTATASTAQVLTVKAGLGTNSAPGKITVYLNTTSSSNALITDHAIKYIYCIGTCEGTDFADHTSTLTSTSQVAVITNDTLTAAQKNYNVYLWLDGSVIGDTHLGLSYAGNISAVATQTES